MVADILSTDLTSQYVLGPTVFAALMPGVSLTVEATTDPGVLASHDQNCSLTVLGNVVTFGTGALIGTTATATAFAAVTVGETGLVQSLTGYGLDIRRSGSVVDNDGVISGGNAGLRYAAGVTGADVANSGTISSLLGSGIVVVGAAGGGTPGLFSFVNSGRIEAALQGVSVASESLDLTNHGAIVGFGTGILLSDDPSLENRLTLVNTGLIQGATVAVDATGHDDSIANSGTLLGAVLLGDGDNLFDNSGLTQGAVTAGAGADEIFNTGTIAGAVALGAEADVVTNSGRLEAGLDLGDGDDRLVNDGVIHGDVLLGDGGNTAWVGGEIHGSLIGGTGGESVEISGWLTGAVSLGDGADTLVIDGKVGAGIDLGTGSDVLRFAATARPGEGTWNGGSGVDRLVSRIDVEDSVNFEIITLKGGAALAVTADAINNTITGNRGSNEIDGGGGADALAGLGGADVLLGGSGADMIDGGRGADELIGGLGADTLAGGLGRDSFIFETLGDSRKKDPDHIVDFERGRDTVDLSAIGETTFSWRGTRGFTESGVAELRYKVDRHGVELRIDADGDGRAEMTVLFDDLAGLGAVDFLL